MFILRWFSRRIFHLWFLFTHSRSVTDSCIVCKRIGRGLSQFGRRKRLLYPVMGCLVYQLCGEFNCDAVLWWMEWFGFHDKLHPRFAPFNCLASSNNGEVNTWTTHSHHISFSAFYCLQPVLPLFTTLRRSYFHGHLDKGSLWCGVQLRDFHFRAIDTWFNNVRIRIVSG